MQDIQLQQSIGSSIGKLLRDTFGKGPESVYVSMGSTFITVYLRNFLSPTERVLLDLDQEMIVNKVRHKLMQSLIPEVRSIIESKTGNTVRELYYDWNFHNKSGMLVGVSSEAFKTSETINEGYEGKKQIDQEIVRISQQAEKVPDEIYSCEINPRTIICVRNGLLVRIEKELIRVGVEATLKAVKRNLGKSYLHNNGHFESILRKRVIDIFVDWDFDLDKSIITFILNPKLPQETNLVETVNFV